MQPLFTIHADEYLVGSYIEQHLRAPNGDKVNVWVLSKDTCIDLGNPPKNHGAHK